MGKGKIVRQVDGDLYDCLMEDRRFYIIEIMGYAGGETDVVFTLHRNHPDYGDAVAFEDGEIFDAFVQSEQ